jgi:hypothetical protein
LSPEEHVAKASELADALATWKAQLSNERIVAITLLGQLHATIANVQLALEKKYEAVVNRQQGRSEKDHS